MIEQDKLMFHGTTREYYDWKFKIHARYQHLADPICLTESADIAASYAVERAKGYRSSPLLIVLTDENALKRIRPWGGISVVDYIYEGEHFTLPLEIKNGRTSEESSKSVKLILNAFCSGMPLEKLLYKKLAQSLIS